MLRSVSNLLVALGIDFLIVQISLVSVSQILNLNILYVLINLGVFHTWFGTVFVMLFGENSGSLRNIKWNFV